MTQSTKLDTRHHLLEVGYSLVAIKGFTAVGLAEILRTANVPKGSFYHYFASKEAFGEALIAAYFERYLTETETILQNTQGSGRERLLRYFELWLVHQQADSPVLHCPVVKLTGEVADLSESMRLILHDGCMQVVQQITQAIVAAQEDGSVSRLIMPEQLAKTLYYLWLGASLMDKLSQDGHPLQAAMDTTLSLI